MIGQRPAASAICDRSSRGFVSEVESYLILELVRIMPRLDFFARNEQLLVVGGSLDEIEAASEWHLKIAKLDLVRAGPQWVLPEYACKAEVDPRLAKQRSHRRLGHRTVHSPLIEYAPAPVPTQSSQ